MADREEIDKLRKHMLEKRQESEKAAYEYCCACEVGQEREQAFEI